MVAKNILPLPNQWEGGEGRQEVLRAACVSAAQGAQGDGKTLQLATNEHHRGGRCCPISI